MAIAIETLGLERMSIDERLELMHAIWESITASAERPPLSDSLRAELDRRLADQRANPGDVVSWDEVKAAALAKVQQ